MWATKGDKTPPDAGRPFVVCPCSYNRETCIQSQSEAAGLRRVTCLTFGRPLETTSTKEAHEKIAIDLLLLYLFFVRCPSPHRALPAPAPESSGNGNASDSGSSRSNPVVGSVVVTLEPPNRLVLGAFLERGLGQAWEYWEGEFGPSELASHVRGFAM